MGRAMLLLVSGLIIVFGVIQMSLNAKQQTMAEFNVQYANSLVARNTTLLAATSPNVAVGRAE